MAQFMGTVQGTRGEASRLGSKSSGIEARINGWDIGARVVISHEDGADVVRVYRTGGSNAVSASQLVAEFKAE